MSILSALTKQALAELISPVKTKQNFILITSAERLKMKLIQNQLILVSSYLFHSEFSCDLMKN